MARALGYKPDKHDPRDRVFAAERTGAAPPEATCLPFLSPVLDQGSLGSCVGNATAGGLYASQCKQGASPEVASRLAIYFLARALEGTVAQDEGCQIRDAFKGIGKFGFAPERFWPYLVDNFATQPGFDFFSAAIDQRDESPGETEYKRINTTGAARIEDIKSAIVLGNTVVFGTNVSENYCSNIGTVDAPVMPPLTIPLAGGHAQLIYGYKTDPNGRILFNVRNSWGEQWGAFGNTIFDESYLAWDQTSDLWVVKAAPLPEVS